MILNCYFTVGDNPDGYLESLCKNIYEKLKQQHPHIDFLHIYHNTPGLNYDEARGLVPNACASLTISPLTFQIINPENNKAIFLSFADRGLECIRTKHFTSVEDRWSDFLEKYDVVQYIGGLGIYLSDHDIQHVHGLKRYKFQPYLSDEQHKSTCFNQYVRPYTFDDKKRRICFYGSDYNPRSEICDILRKHPLFDIVLTNNTTKMGYRKEEYYKNISDSRIGLSFNGYGEVSVRDFEYFGLKIPSIRAKLNTQFYNEIVPNKHYISVDIPSSNASNEYDMSYKECADKIIHTAENVIDDYNTLKSISDNSYDYCVNYLTNQYLTDLFFKIANIDLLK